MRMRSAAMLLSLALAAGPSEARIGDRPPAPQSEPPRLEIAASRKCPFLTRWSAQWRKCVWLWQGTPSG